MAESTATPASSPEQPARRKSFVEGIAGAVGGAVGQVAAVTTRGGSEVLSVATTGKSLTKRENDAATKLQAIVRGNNSRAELSAEPEPGMFDFLNCCSSPRAKKAKVKDILPGKPPEAAVLSSPNLATFDAFFLKRQEADVEGAAKLCSTFMTVKTPKGTHEGIDAVKKNVFVQGAPAPESVMAPPQPKPGVENVYYRDIVVKFGFISVSMRQELTFDETGKIRMLEVSRL